MPHLCATELGLRPRLDADQDELLTLPELNSGARNREVKASDLFQSIDADADGCLDAVGCKFRIVSDVKGCSIHVIGPMEDVLQDVSLGMSSSRLRRGQQSCAH